MSLFRTLLRAVVDVTTIPLDVAHDVLNLGNDSPSKIECKTEKLSEDAEQIVEDIEDLI
jgi:mannose-6-phosphate isomerase-like protein (cupin superfamily)